MSKFLTDLQPICRTGPALECSECRAPILRDHIYYVDGSDVGGSHPYCWHCAMSIMMYLGQIAEAQIYTKQQFGPVRRFPCAPPIACEGGTLQAARAGSGTPDTRMLPVLGHI